ncbi:MAG: dienelactone hydrolase family protein [Bacteroidia bacterium]|nr:dienelactone hydrolase family protein [Bacteroidia bacterium]
MTILWTNSEIVQAQVIDTFLLKYAASKNDTILYKRIIRFDERKKSYYVRDYYPTGQIQMEAHYSSFDKNIKEGWQCNYHSNTKQSFYQEWYENGQLKFSGRFKNGRATGRCQWWYGNGQREADEGRLNGQLHGRVRYWTEQGDPELDLKFKHGVNQNPKKVSYPYLPYLPKDYNTDTLKRWPLIIYLHGGSQRGTNLKKLYDSGIPDQIYRGREFPFIIISPLCPLHLRWSTDDWFENFFNEITCKYRIDTTRIYLTGLSLGGNGTWYIAEKYPEKFAAIAPISGFTSETDYIGKNINKLFEMPIWAFHGRTDDVVPFEETERIVKILEGNNKDLKFTAEPAVGHWMHWIVYPGDELYEWFLTKHL